MREEVTNSAFRTPHSAFLLPVYFPFTFISPSLLEAMSLCFHHLLLYQPAHAKRHPVLEPWIDKGFLDLRSPFEKVIDKKPLEAALRNFSTWGQFHQRADLAYLKTVRNAIAPVSPEIPAIASEISGADAERPKVSDGEEFSWQLFLHFAQEFDQQSWELREELSRLSHQYETLQSAFRQDQDGEAHDLASIGLSTDGEEDLGSFMIAKRMAAWNRLFQKDPAGSGLFITDSRSAYDYLLDDVEEKHEVLNLNITFTQPESNEVPKDHATLADDLQEILNMLLTTPWNQALEEQVMHAGSEIEARMCHEGPLNMKVHDRSVSVRWHVVPHQLAPSLFNRCCGTKTAQGKRETVEVKNTVVGLMREASPAPFA
jgi:hypothetical protein